MRVIENEFKEVLEKTFEDVGYNTIDFIDLLADKMALSHCNMEGGTPVDLIEKCKTSPLTKRLQEAELW